MQAIETQSFCEGEKSSERRKFQVKVVELNTIHDTTED